MPVRDLIAFLRPEDSLYSRIADGLPYRDFMTVGLLLRRMNASHDRRDARQSNGMPPDNWIYIQEPDVKIGRLQVFNNWSPALVADPATIWLGLEYFCREGDDLWSMDNGRFIDFAAAELEKIGLIDRSGCHRRDFGSSPQGISRLLRRVWRVRHGAQPTWIDSQIFIPVGRNGMHRYNNQDHSMLAANSAVSSISNGGNGKPEIWRINAEDDYHEEIGEPQ